MDLTIIWEMVERVEIEEVGEHQSTYQDRINSPCPADEVGGKRDGVGSILHELARMGTVDAVAAEYEEESDSSSAQVGGRGEITQPCVPVE